MRYGIALLFVIFLAACSAPKDDLASIKLPAHTKHVPRDLLAEAYQHHLNELRAKLPYKESVKLPVRLTDSVVECVIDRSRGSKADDYGVLLFILDCEAELASQD